MRPRENNVVVRIEIDELHRRMDSFETAMRGVRNRNRESGLREVLILPSDVMELVNYLKGE